MEGSANNPIPPTTVEQQLHSNPAPVIPTQLERSSPLTSLASANFIRPKPKLQRLDHVIAFERTSFGFGDYVSRLWQYLSMILINLGSSEDDFITEEDFCRMAKTILLYRVQQVRELRLARRPATNRIILPRGFALPAALAEIIAGVGEVFLEEFGYYYLPQLPAAPAELPTYYTVDPTIVLSFIAFVDLLARRQAHRSVPLSSDPIGTQYWLLDHVNPDVMVTTIESSIGSATPADGLLAAICNISQDLGGTRGFTYVQSTSVDALRYAYFSMN